MRRWWRPKRRRRRWWTRRSKSRRSRRHLEGPRLKAPLAAESTEENVSHSTSATRLTSPRVHRKLLLYNRPLLLDPAGLLPGAAPTDGRGWMNPVGRGYGWHGSSPAAAAAAVAVAPAHECEGLVPPLRVSHHTSVPARLFCQ